MCAQKQDREQMKADGLCVEWVHDRDFMGTLSHYCGRPAKRDGMCGIHLGAANRAAKKDAERAEAKIADAARQAEAEALCARLQARGITAKPYYDGLFKGGYTGDITISATDAATLVALVEQAKQ